MTSTKLEGPIPGNPFLMMGAFDLAASGYLAEEWFVSGSACGYALQGGQGEDGCWQARRERAAPYRTRVVLRRPADLERWNGTLVVEWLNVTGGLDVPPGWFFLHRHLMREGAAWAGVSAQRAGIDGGGVVQVMPLKQADPERYAPLSHPGDAFAYDVFTQVGRALRTGGEGPLGPRAAECAIAIGESQSAGFLVSYVNAVDPLERCFDAFLIHGRPGRAAGIDGSYIRAPANGDLAAVARTFREAHRIREDVRVPVLTLQSETDVIGLGGWLSRQPDGERFRLWELAGAAHFDTYGLVASQFDDGSLPIEALARHLVPTDRPMGLETPLPINSGPQQHYVLQAALAHLERWARDGAPPPGAPRLETDDAGLVTDSLGNVRGGLRTPWVEAPSAVLSGLGQHGEGFLFLFGTTRPLAPETLRKLYPDGIDEHRARFEAETGACLRAGFLLPEDAAEIRALGRLGWQPSGWRKDGA